MNDCSLTRFSAANNIQTGEGVAIKKVTNVFSKKILAKRALREIKLLQHFRGKPLLLNLQNRLLTKIIPGHRNVRRSYGISYSDLTEHRLPAYLIWIFPSQTTSMNVTSMKAGALR